MLLYVWPTILTLLPLSQAQCSGSTTISTSAEATALADCTTYAGDVDIRGIEGEISLDGLEEVAGDLTASVVNDMTGLSASSLQTIGGRLRISYADLLATLALPSLRNVGTLALQDLPNLTSIDAGEAGITNVTSVTIRNTALANLDWLRSSQVEDIRIEGNLNLTDMSLSGLRVAESYIVVQGNQPVSLSVPDLELAYNVSVQGCSAVSLPALAQVNRSLSFIDNSFENLELPNILDVGGNFMLWNNSMLSSISVPILANVSDDLVICHNPKLGRLSFPDLGIVEGDISANGSFSEVDMPSLTDVQGAVTLRSSVPLNCTAFEAYNRQNVLKARFICEGGTDEPLDSASGNGSSASSSEGSGGLSTGAKAGIAVGIIVVVGAIALVALFYWRKNRKSREGYAFRHAAVAAEGKERYKTPGDIADTSNGREQYTKAELPDDGVRRTASELHGDSIAGLSTTEKRGNGVAVELPANEEVTSELPSSSPHRDR